jgi:hypothetical protein
VSAIFALDDLPEKWKQYTELNESYVKAGKFTPDEYAKHANEVGEAGSCYGSFAPLSGAALR